MWGMYQGRRIPKTVACPFQHVPCRMLRAMAPRWLCHAPFTLRTHQTTCTTPLHWILRSLHTSFFLGGHHTAVGNALKNDPVNINGENVPPGAVSRSLGVYGFDPKILCRELGDTETCDFGDGANLYGWALTGAYNQIALLCTSKKCVAAEVSYFQTRSTIKPHALGLAVSSLKQMKVRPPLQGGKLYPLYVFIGVLATIIISIVGSYVADYIVQPAPAKPTFPVQNAATRRCR
ncbi:hypothetical protein BCY84_22415 [Trypanosoma cruzi cruzi]|nr:hypothetical protein BCY84_22415 [Trypanosoma cruzi cruzi]